MPLRIRSWRDIANTRGFRSALRAAVPYFSGRRGQRLVHILRIYYRVRIRILLRTGQTVGLLTRRSEALLWVDGQEVFRRLERLLAKARHHVFIQMFIWRDDETGRWLAKLLLDAAERGVHVDIAKEAIGDFFEFRGDFLSTRDSSDPLWRAFWRHKRIRITHAADNDHAKVFTIDGSILLLTGMNIADIYRAGGWHDYMVELRGSRFVEQFMTRAALATADDAPVQLVMNAETRKDIRPVVTRLLSSAREHIVIEVSYISDPDILDLLVRRSHAGVRITMLLPEMSDFHHHANLLTIGKLLSEGRASHVHVLLYPGMFHAKALLIDGVTAFVGSANLFTASLDDMGEVNVLVRGKRRFLRTLRESMRRSILQSRPITSPPSFLWLSRWLAWLGL